MTKMRFGNIATILLLAANTGAAKSIAERGQVGELTSAYFYYCTPAPKPPVTTRSPSLHEGVFIVDVDITINVYVTVFVDVCPEIGLCHLQYTLTQTCTRTSICHPPLTPLGFTVTEKPCDIYGQPATITVTEPCDASPPPDCSEWPPNAKQVPPPALDSGQIPPHLGGPTQLPPNVDDHGRNPPGSNVDNAPNADNQGQNPPSPANNPYLGDPLSPANNSHGGDPTLAAVPTHSFNPYLPSMPSMPQASPALPPSLPSNTGSSTGHLHNGADRMAQSYGLFAIAMLALIATIICSL